jgi:hypothetical protein
MSEAAAQTPAPEPTPQPEPQLSPPAAAPLARSNLHLRLITAAFLIPAICIVVALGGWWLLLTIEVITAIAIHEFYHLIEAKGAVPVRGVGMAA